MKDGHCLAEQTRVFFHEHAIRPHVVLETHQIEILQGLIASGQGGVERGTGRTTLTARASPDNRGEKARRRWMTAGRIVPPGLHR
jgi:hypothetical protein